MLKNYHHKRVVGRRSLATSASVLALTVMLLSACANQQPRANVSQGENANTAAVTNNTNSLIGKTLTVRSDVAKLVGTSAFTIDDEQFFGGQETLVVNASGQPFDVPTDGTELQITGEVRNFKISDIAREFNLDLPLDTYVTYENQPAIIAKSFALAPKPSQIASNPYAFYNQTVAVESEIKQSISPLAFLLGEDQLLGSSNLLVLNPGSQRSVTQDQEVVVVGVLRPFVAADIEKDYNLTGDVNWQRQLETEYRNKPVLVAQYVFPLTK